VDETFVATRSHVHAGLTELPGVRFALVAEYIIAGRLHHRWRQILELLDR
jgi:hypothetical protein